MLRTRRSAFAAVPILAALLVGLVEPDHQGASVSARFGVADPQGSIAGVPSRAERVADTEALAALGKAWGLLKYYNARAAQGPVDWDAALIRAIPRVIDADTTEAVNHELMMLVRSVNLRLRVPAGAPIDQPETDPAFSWIEQDPVLDPVARVVLRTIRHSEVPRTNRYVKPGPVTNPDFSGEAPYATPEYPVLEYRLLALFRYWNMVQYFFPYRDIMDRPWPEVLPELIAQFRDAADATQYHLAAAAAAASIDDAHGFVSSRVLSAHWGSNAAPLRTRYIEGQTVITKVFERLARGADIRVGDVVTHINGVPVAELRQSMRRYIWGSNEGSRQRNIDQYLTRSRTGSITLGLSRDGAERTVPVGTVPVAETYEEEDAIERRQPVSRLLAGNIGYVHMGLLERPQVPEVMTSLMSTRAIVFDVRNYPNGTLFDIAQYLNPERRRFAIFTRPVYERPGTFRWDVGNSVAGPNVPSTNYYRGKVILLGDERTQSHAEFTLMALRTAPDVTMVGSPTAGADGNVSQILLPGGITTFFSGIGVFYPDQRPTQRVGIVPDVHVTPTISGIRNGVDEVLERALSIVR